MTTKISDETPSQEALLTEAEQRQILFEWNMTYRAYPKNLCLHQLFETQVERTPDAVALICEQEQFTYQQLNRQANQLAHYLQTLGVEPEVRVGICMKRSLELVVGLLGILKAGGVYVPLDPVYPHERLSFMLTDAQISVLLIQRQLLAQLPAHQAKLVCLDAGQQALSQQQENPISEINAENLAYVIYTSGSTGRPKGAMNTHQGVCNTLLWLQETNQLSQNDCLVHKTSLSFDLSVEELFWPLMTGARLVVAHPESYQESTYLLSLIKQYAITVLDLVPSILQMLLEEPDWPEGQSVRLVICGGETLSPELQKRFFASHRASLLNTYGPTEAAIDATFWHCGRNSKASTVPIGHPLANTQIYLLDKHLQPVPVGVPAELYIGGVNLARGYLNRADLTAERFVPHPFAGTVQGVGPGVRIYRTGDLARYRSDGTIEYLGRVDQQIKLRGFRIEPGEIESVLEQHPAVRQAVVVLSTESASDQRLVAYVVLHKDYQLPMSMLREHLAGQIPEYMVPSIFVQLEALPLTPNGKLDRRALPAPLHSERMITDAFVAPTLPLHHQLVHIWEDLLHVKPIGIKDNFFELGGHSLLATRLFDCIAQVFGKKLPLSTFVTDATIAYLTDVLMTIKISDEIPSQEDLLNAPLVLAQEHIQIPAMVTDVLKELSCQEEAPLLLVLLAAFEVLLHRYTGQDDLVIGILPTDYPEMESEASTSPFARPHILRTDLSGDPTFRTLLERVREVMLAAQQLSEPKLLLQVILAVEASQPNLPSTWTFSQMEAEATSSTFNLMFSLQDQLQGLTACIAYRSDLFEQETMVRMAGHWQTLLLAIASGVEQSISRLPLLTQQERSQLLVEWNPSQAPLSAQMCLHHLFEAQVQRTPHARAVLFEDEQLTYQQLNARANQLARHLQGLGVGPDIPVGICVQRSLHMIVGLLGILKAGGAYVPLDPNYPVERLAFMLEDTQAPVLLTQTQLQKSLPPHTAQVIYLDQPLSALTPETSSVALPSEVRAHHLAYIIYTSGSTGKPKGVAIEHRNTVIFLDWATACFSSQHLAAVLASTSINFDLSVFEIFSPLSCGGSVVLCENLFHLSDSRVAEQVTLVNTVPSVLTQFLKANPLPSSVRVVNLAGEPLSRALAQMIYQHNTVEHVWNLYGPTEDTTYSTCSLVHKEASDAPAIGHPLPGTQAYILDQHLEPVPIGVAGELYLGGQKLARCYLNRPELTAERFLSHPFSTEPEARLYRTGDLARYRTDGTIEHLGRLDFQVKLRGFRIELGEIEAVLSQHPAILQTVVIAREDALGDKRLVAYVVLDPAQPDLSDLTEDISRLLPQLHSLLKAQLPAYMIPSAFVRLEALPLTPNGKLDRRALPAPQPSERMITDTFVAPTLPVHHQLVHIWEDLLNVRPIGIKDNFFALGGHSLLTTRLFDCIAQTFGKRLPFSTFVTDATIAYLTDVLIQETQTASLAPIVAVQTSGAKRPFFFLHGQWTGGAFYSLELARSLGPDQPFYLLEPYKFDDLCALPSFEDMAAAHLEALRSIQPQGPYLLGGWCNGGLIAYEMARQLQAQGQRVDLLILMDSDPAVSRWNRTHRLISEAGSLLRLAPKMQVDLFLWYRHLRLSFYYWRLNKGKQTKQVQAEFEQNEGMLRRDWPALYDWVYSGYMPYSYAGKITLFWTDEEPHRSRKWQQVMEGHVQGEVEMHIIPGNHISSRTQYLSVLAEKLSLCLSKVQTNILSNIS